MKSNLRTLLEADGLSVDNITAATWDIENQKFGLSRQTVHNIMNGKHQPRVVNALIFLRAVNRLRAQKGQQPFTIEEMFNGQ